MAATLLGSSRIGGGDWFDLSFIYASRVNRCAAVEPTQTASREQAKLVSLVNTFTKPRDVKGDRLKKL
jgi:hypothetical protein